MTKAKLIAENKDLKLLLQQKELIIAQLQKMIFGPTSERYTSEEAQTIQMSLFADLEAIKLKEQQAEEETINVSYERKKTVKKQQPNRIPLPDHLPRIDVVLKPEGDLTGLVKIGEEVTEILDIIPPVFQVIRLVRPKYADPLAKTEEVVQPIRIAPMPDRVIDRGIPSARLLAYILICKFVDHLPYYRQIQIFKRIGLSIKSNTINGWIAKTCTLIKPLYDAFCKYIFSQNYLEADESTVKVLRVKKNGKKGKAHTGYYWVYYDPINNQVAFIFDPGRGRKYAANHLKDFKGSLQTDGLSVYDAFDKLDYITLIACMAHIRRKFVEAIANDKKRAEPIVLLIRQLYAIEDYARENKYTHQQRLELRQAKAVPIMEKLKEKLDDLHNDPQVLPGSAIGKAVHYALGRWKYQQRYLHDGKLEIDNNLVENAIRALALGRKNWLFAGSEQGARWGAMIYTLVGSALRHNLNPLDYISDILRRLPDTKMDQLHTLFPVNWEKRPKSDLDLI
ncbi:MAG: IS66 family transposase [Desulfobulbaceae bacterium]|nr:IS66 family transposase [Desulfobulbaceae bacterium]